MVGRRRRILLAALVATLPGLVARPAWAQEEIPLDTVPRTLPAGVRAALDGQRARLESAVDRMNDTIAAFNRRCGSVRADDAGAVAWCRGEQGRLLPIIQGIEAQKVAFNAAVDSATVRSTRRRPGIDEIYVPSPVVAQENATLARDPAAWLAAAQRQVHAAVQSSKEWTRGMLRAIDELSPPEPQYRITRLANLEPGDILLVAPTDPRRDASGASLSAAIQGADFLTRVSSDRASGRALQAARQTVTPASHALTFVRDVDGTFLFLDHTLEGSRVLDDRAFLLKYGARELYVARPNEVVDGRALWSAAREAATQQKSDYGLFGKNVVCSERAGLAVARVTGQTPNHRLGPVDITPGDFFDAQGATGKHFTVTRLYITPTRE